MLLQQLEFFHVLQAPTAKEKASDLDELDSIVEINIENCFTSLSQTFLAFFRRGQAPGPVSCCVLSETWWVGSE